MNLNPLATHSLGEVVRATAMAVAMAGSGCATTHVTLTRDDYCAEGPGRSDGEVAFFFIPPQYQNREAYLRRIAADPSFHTATAIAVTSGDMEQDCGQIPFNGAMRCLQVANQDEALPDLSRGHYAFVVVGGSEPYTDRQALCARGVTVRTVMLGREE